MSDPKETYETLNEVREFLKTQSETSDAARKLMEKYPDELQLDHMIGSTVWHMQDQQDVRAGIPTNVKVEGDPVFYSPLYGGWIFWDEVWAWPSKPYNTRNEARKAVMEYCRGL